MTETQHVRAYELLTRYFHLIAKRNLNNGMAHVSEKIVLRCTTAG
jgi:hypothetical protein